MPSGRELNSNAEDVAKQEVVMKWKETLADQEDVVVKALTTNPAATDEQIEAAYQILDKRKRDEDQQAAA